MQNRRGFEYFAVRASARDGFEKIALAFVLLVVGMGLGYWWAVEAYGVFG